MTPDQFILFAGALPDPFFLLNRAGEIQAANPAAHRLLGVAARCLGGTRIHDFVQEEVGKLDINLRMWARSREMLPISLQLRSADGSVVGCHCSGALIQPRSDDQSALILLRCLKKQVLTRSFVALNEKIDRLRKEVIVRKRVEAELGKYHEHLEELVQERTRELKNAQSELVRKERLAVLGQLTATVSHELRNPLGVMRLSLHVIEKRIDKRDRRIQQAIERADRNIDRCDHIINELLDFTRGAELDRHVTRIDEWLESVIDEQEICKGIQVEKNLSLKDVELTIDPDRMCRAVINIVENACHAMLEDNQLVKVRKGSRLGIKTGGNEKRIEIIISDTGSGIPEPLLERVFEPLFSTKGFGVGLGMPTVKQIMEQHGGGIEIDSAAGKGTSVTLWLPGGAVCH